jgi:hypothetical protein
MNSATQALERCRDGFIAERATGQPCLDDWREETLRMIESALSQRTDPWRQAVDEALIAHALDCTGPGDDPKEKVKELIEWAVTIATDPRVSETAAREQEASATGAEPAPTIAEVLDWAASMATHEDPRTSDWYYDDRHELAKAILKGPESWRTMMSGTTERTGKALLALSHQLDDEAQRITEERVYEFAALIRMVLGLDGADAALATPTTSTTASEFPRRIVALLQEVAEGPFEDGNGECLMEDAKKALAWLANGEKNV